MGRVAPAVTSCGKSTVIKVLSVWAAEVGKKKKKKSGQIDGGWYGVILTEVNRFRKAGKKDLR